MLYIPNYMYKYIFAAVSTQLSELAFFVSGIYQNSSPEPIASKTRNIPK